MEVPLSKPAFDQGQTSVGPNLKHKHGWAKAIHAAHTHAELSIEACSSKPR